MMIPATAGAGILAALLKGGGVVLPYDPVLAIIGDSNARASPTAPDQAAAVAAYVDSGRVKVLNQSNAFVAYAPGTVTGMNGLVNTPWVGPEAGFIRRFLAKYQSNTLNIIKAAQAGGGQTKLSSLGTITASISGNVLTITSGTVAISNILVGAGLPPGLCVSSGSGPYNLSVIGSGVNPNLTIASMVMNKYSAANFSVTQSNLWSGIAPSVTNGYRNKGVVGLATLPSPKVVAVLYMLGSNDAGSTSLSEFPAEAAALLASMKTNWGVASDVPIIIARPIPGYGGTIRAYSQDLVNNDPAGRLLDLDSYATNDGVHFTVASLDAIGSAAFDLAGL